MWPESVHDARRPYGEVQVEQAVAEAREREFGVAAEASDFRDGRSPFR